MKKIYISTDSRGKITPTGWYHPTAWPYLLRQKLPEYEIDISSWDRIMCTYDSVLRDCRTISPRPSIVITQLGQLEMCIGPEMQKLHWTRSIPGHENVGVYYHPCKSPDRNAYDTYVNCEAYLRKILFEFNSEFKHLAIHPTRKCCDADVARLDILRNILTPGPHISLNDLDHNVVTFDGEHYTHEMHQIIANRVYDWIKANE